MSLTNALLDGSLDQVYRLDDSNKNTTITHKDLNNVYEVNYEQPWSREDEVEEADPELRREEEEIEEIAAELAHEHHHEDWAY